MDRQRINCGKNKKCRNISPAGGGELGNVRDGENTPVKSYYMPTLKYRTKTKKRFISIIERKAKKARIRKERNKM
jgi:hypothetical protein